MSWHGNPAVCHLQASLFLLMECQEVLWYLTLCNKPSDLLFFFPPVCLTTMDTPKFSLFICVYESEALEFWSSRIGKLTLIRLLCYTLLQVLNVYKPIYSLQHYCQVGTIAQPHFLDQENKVQRYQVASLRSQNQNPAASWSFKSVLKLPLALSSLPASGPSFCPSDSPGQQPTIQVKAWNQRGWGYKSSHYLANTTPVTLRAQ